jgi:hypothetical protein
MADPGTELPSRRRTIPDDVELDTPLYGAVWRATQRWAEELLRLRGAAVASIEREQEAWITLGDELFRLRAVHATLSETAADEKGSGADHLGGTVRRLEQTLRNHGVEVLAPVGTAYTDELGEILENAGQLPGSELTEPIVAQVLSPVVKKDGEVIRLGKAIIAVPVREG